MSPMSSQIFTSDLLILFSVWARFSFPRRFPSDAGKPFSKKCPLCLGATVRDQHWLVTVGLWSHNLYMSLHRTAHTGVYMCV